MLRKNYEKIPTIQIVNKVLLFLKSIKMVFFACFGEMTNKLKNKWI